MLGELHGKVTLRVKFVPEETLLPFSLPGPSSAGAGRSGNHARGGRVRGKAMLVWTGKC